MKSKFKFINLLLFFLLISCNSNNIEDIDMIPIKKGISFQYINASNQVLINPQFSNASVFRNGIALVKTSNNDSKWGFIDEQGKYIIKPTYKNATIFSEGIAFVVLENKFPIAISENGAKVFELKNVKMIRVFKNNLAAFTNHDTIEKWGFINKKGTIAIKDDYYEVSNFSENKCAVKDENNKWGYIDQNGKTVINFIFDDASDFSKKTAIVYLNGKAGVINEAGNYLIKPTFTTLYKDGATYLFQKNKKWGWCDVDGKIIINPQFEIASKFNNNELASVKIGKKYGYINKEGKVIISPQFNYASVFNNEIALIKNNGKIGFINKQGKSVIKPQYDGFSFDYLSYINSGKSLFYEVETDLFDIKKLASKINLALPDGLTFNNTIAEILKKYKIKNSELTENQAEIILYKNKPIVANAAISLQLLKSSNDAFSNNPSALNKKPDGFVYQLHISGRASGKCNEIIDLLQLKNYKQIKSGYVQDNIVSVYKGNDRQIVVTNDRNNLCIYILRVDYDLKAYTENISKFENEIPETSYNQDY